MLRAADTNIAHQWILTLAMKEQRGRTSGLGKRLFARSIGQTVPYLPYHLITFSTLFPDGQTDRATKLLIDTLISEG